MEKIVDMTENEGSLGAQSNKGINYEIPLDKRELSDEEKQLENKRLERICKIEKLLTKYKEKIYELTGELKVLTKYSPHEEIQHIQNNVKQKCENCLQMKEEKEIKEKELKSYKERVIKLESVNKQLEKEGLTDKLTQIGNREAFNQDAKKRIEKGESFSIAFIDIDHFKNINDTYGHSTGDQVLKFVAKQLKWLGSAYRRGGEEYIIIDNCSQSELKNKIDKLKSGTLGQPHRLPKHDNISIEIKISTGVTSHIKGQSISELTTRADDLMYIAKQTRDTTITDDEALNQVSGNDKIVKIK